MATRVTSKNIYIGTHGETKPHATAGSRFYAYDSGQEFFFDGVTWRQQKGVDNVTGANIGISYEHHEIHGGSAFTAYYTRTTDATDGHRTGLYIKTPATTKRIHLVVSFAASAAANFSICEAPTIASTTGTAANAIYNRDRNSTTTSLCLDNAATPAANKFTTLTEAQIAGDGTWATGTVIRTEPLQAGLNPRAAGGQSRDTEEYILLANTKYVFLITNVGANANTHYILLDWYENTSLV